MGVFYANWFSAIHLFGLIYFTNIAIKTVRELSWEKALPPRGRFNVKIFSIFALTSYVLFLGLMGAYVRHSYQSWKTDNANLVTDTVWDNLRLWITTSSPYLDFAGPFIANDQALAWATGALSFTWDGHFIIAQEGLTRRVPKLWYFLMLAQIAPVSVAMNMMFIAMEYRTDRQYHVSRRYFRWSPYLSGAIVYLSTLLCLPSHFHATPILAVFVFRYALFIFHFFTGQRAPLDKGVVFAQFIESWGVRCAFFALLLHRSAAAGSWEERFAALADPAVRMLAVDWMFGIFCFLIWRAIATPLPDELAPKSEGAKDSITVGST